MFEVFHLVHSVPFPIGFSEEVFLNRQRIHLLLPFTHMALFTSYWGSAAGGTGPIRGFSPPRTTRSNPARPEAGWRWSLLISSPLISYQLNARRTFPHTGSSPVRSESILVTDP